MTRRRFIGLGAIGLVGVPALLDACGGSAAPATAPASTSSSAAPAGSTAPASNAAPASRSISAPASTASGTTGVPQGDMMGSVRLPAYVPVQGAKPDLPGSADGLISPGFLTLPKNPFSAVKSPPGKGGDVTVLTWSFTGTLPPPVEKNTLWQAMNKDIGANVKFNIVAYADYGTRFSAVMAGNDLPDLMFVSPVGTTVDQLPAFLQAKCADLTPYLSGDAAKDYPNLANFPTLTWRNVVFNNAIYGVPIPYPIYFLVTWMHQELLDQDNLAVPKTADEFKKVLQAVTKPQSNRWGTATSTIDGYGVMDGWFPAMFGAPNMWSLDSSGKLTHEYETDQFRQAASYARDLYAAGVFHPNSATYNAANLSTDFQADRFVFDFTGFQGQSSTFWDAAPALHPPGKFRILPPFPAQAGQKATYFASTGSFGFTVLKKASPDRVKELLGILNYLAAPFGSREYNLQHYGVKGVDYTPNDKGNPILTAKGKLEAALPWQLTARAPWVLFYPPAPADFANAIQAAEKSLLPAAIFDPTLGAYSNTSASKGPSLTQAVLDSVNGIVKGTTPLSQLDTIITTWRRNGGDQIRKEYEQSIAAAKR